MTIGANEERAIRLAGRVGQLAAHLEMLLPWAEEALEVAENSKRPFAGAEIMRGRIAKAKAALEETTHVG